MDRSWMKKSRVTEEYQNGLRFFLDYAFRNACINGRILCPCKHCKIGISVSREEALEHLTVDGFIPGYTQWIAHGELLSNSSRFENQHDNSGTSTYVDNMEGLVNDAFGVQMEDGYVEDTTDFPQDMEIANGQARDFFKLIDASQQKLYEGCEKFTKLSFIIRLLHLKCLGKLNNTVFDMFLDLLREAFPDAMTGLPKSYYEAEKLLKDLGLGYEKIDACPNDCTLYWGVNTNRNSCQTCHELRWRTSDKDPTGGERKIARKVLWYFPLKPRLQRLFMSAKTASHMRWHAESRTKDGNMRHPADSPAWMIFDNEFGQPVGGENSKLCHFLGTVARNGKYCPIDVKNWHLMPRTKKTDILDVVKLRFHVPIIAEKWILTSVGSKWRNWKHCLKTKHWCDNVSIAHLIEERDERVEEDQWIRLLTYWKTEESLKVSERNVDARGKKLMNQRTGKTSFAHIKAKVTKEKGRCPTRVELFNLCFVPSNENPSEVVLSKYSAMQERSNQLSEGSDDAIGPDDIFAQVMGKDVSGHVRMMGQGVCPRDVWSETPRSTSNRLLMEHQAKIAHLQNMLLTQQRPQTSQANIGQYPSTSNSFSPNATSALPLQVGEYVSLKSLFDPQKIVAKGYVYSTDPSKKVGGQSLGLNWCEINVKVIDEPEEQLIRPYDNLQNISQTAGQMVAWPCHLVTPIEDLTI